MKLLQKKLSDGHKEDFYEPFIQVYWEVSEKARRNKKKHFFQQNFILGVSLGVSFLNIVVSFLTALNAWNWLISLVTSLSSVCAILVTFLMARKGMNQYLETWLRHQKNKAAMEEETMKYVFEAEEYRNMGREEAAQKFVDRAINAWSRNQSSFSGNMEKYSSADRKSG